MVKIIGLVEGQDLPMLPIGELQINVDIDRSVPLGVSEEELFSAIGAHYNVPLRMLLGKSAQPMTATMQAAQQEYFEQLESCQIELQACRTAWESSDRSVPFPDYWAGWSAATTGSIAVANMAGKLNAALQPTLDGMAFKKLRKEREALAKALLANGIGFGFGADGSLTTWKNGEQP